MTELLLLAVALLALLAAAWVLWRAHGRIVYLEAYVAELEDTVEASRRALRIAGITRRLEDVDTPPSRHRRR